MLKNIFAYFLLAFAFGAAIQPTYSTSSPVYRLPKVILPDLYDISIKPYLSDKDGAKQFTFDGEVNITLHTVAQGIKSIALHKSYLNITEITLYFDANDTLIQRIDNASLIYDTITEILTINLETALRVQTNYKLNFKYTGLIRDGMAGVFRGSYSISSWYAVTQLQRIDARSAFPCFDEPEFKAKFRMRINRPKELKSYFNTKLVSSTGDDNDRYVDTFEVSPIMSTYLVAFMVGEFEERGNADLKLIMNPKLINQTDFTYEVANKTLKAYNNYTQLPYKTLGNDILQMAGSERFPHNGMENWGLIIYRDNVLAHQPGYTDGWANKEYTITIVVHETAHMWFGDSVTFEWWSYFWLNEAFARYYQYFMAHELYPEFELDKRFVVNQVQLIFRSDASNSTQPLTSPLQSIESPEQIAYKFSGIAYAKGASIVRMVCNLMGKENFDSAMREYLKENHLRNTVPADLFKHWKQHWPKDDNVNLDQFFKDWTEQVGYPMITVGVTSDGEYSLKQQRFLLDPKDGSDPSLTYTVPITFTTNRENNFNDLRPKFYFDKMSKEIKFGIANMNKWIILNLQQSNYYRVFYEAPLLERIRKALTTSNHSGIHALNRAQIVDDLFAYGRNGLMDYDKIFEFMEYLSNEFDYLVWYAAFNGLQFIHDRLTVSQHKDFEGYLFNILKGVYQKLGFAEGNDTIPDIYLRNYVISWMCKYHNGHCNDEAQRVFWNFVNTNTKPSPDFRETLYCAAARNAAFNTYTVLSKQYANETLKSEQEKLLRAMGCAKGFVNYHYAFILGNAVPQDLKVMAITSIYSQTSENIEPLFIDLSDSVEILAKSLDSWPETANIFADISNYFTTRHQLEMYKKFIASKGHLFGSSVDTLNKSVKTVETNLNWSEKRLGKFFAFLEKYNAGSHGVPVSAATMIIVFIAMFRLMW